MLQTGIARLFARPYKPDVNGVVCGNSALKLYHIIFFLNAADNLTWNQITNATA